MASANVFFAQRPSGFRPGGVTHLTQVCARPPPRGHETVDHTEGKNKKNKTLSAMERVILMTFPLLTVNSWNVLSFLALKQAERTT